MATVAAGNGDRLGETLLGDGLLSREQLGQALAEQKTSKHRLGYVLVKLGFVPELEITKILARQHRMPAVDLSRFEVDPKILKLVPSDMATKGVVLPLKREGRTLTVAMADPSDLGLLEDLKFITRFDLFPVIAGEFTLRALIEKHYQAGNNQQELENLLRDMEAAGEDLEVVEEQEEETVTQAQLEDAPVVKLINGLLIEAVKRGASDIHIEPFEHEIRVRYRIDGALLEIMRPPLKMKAALTSRIKILSQLNIAERRVPQDGRLKLKMGNRVIDFRVSTLPVLYGEKIVMRILDKGNLTLDLSKFGFEPKAEKDLMKNILNPYGMVLVTGPTGSGKTTTLYSALSRVNTPEVNIMTAEDPVEYNLMGINQVLVRTEIGLTFAAALKAFLRQDPNIIMIGEIRDLETGGIAIKAALTGHLVLSTLHTNDAASTITRMIDMGIEPFNVASAVNLVVAQRLVRRICKECKSRHTYTDEELAPLGTDLENLRSIQFMKGTGCETCSGTGYKGRAGLYEVMAMSPEIRRMVLRGASVSDIQEQAVLEGMLTLRMDGIVKIGRGVTTLEEVVKETARMSFNLRALLEEMIEKEASDLHITTGERPKLRIDGEIADSSVTEVLTPKDTLQLAYSVLTENQKKRFETEDELDFSFGIQNLARFRGNCFKQRGCVSMVIRMIPFNVRTFQELGLPPVIAKLAERPRGLILVTGPTGSGKSTTLAAIIDKINKERKGHIITVEDPIEFIHRHQSCIVNQREIGTDTKSFQTALKYALREDPDVILVGEMRDLETIAAALTIAETGHLALATLHTNSAAESINRIIDVFPSNQQSQVRQLAFVLEGVITQVLLPKSRGRGRAMAAEIMVATPAIRALIRDDKIHQIYSAMQSGKKHGMQTMNDSLYQLYTNREVDQEECERVSSEPKEFLRMIGVTPMEEQEIATINGTQRAAGGRR